MKSRKEKGFAQQPGIEYEETFSPLARLDTVREVLGVAAKKKMAILSNGR